jgi:hypothetical protein
MNNDVLEIRNMDLTRAFAERIDADIFVLDSALSWRYMRLMEIAMISDTLQFDQQHPETLRAWSFSLPDGMLSDQAKPAPQSVVLLVDRRRCTGMFVINTKDCGGGHHATAFRTDSLELFNAAIDALSIHFTGFPVGDQT